MRLGSAACSCLLLLVSLTAGADVQVAKAVIAPLPGIPSAWTGEVALYYDEAMEELYLTGSLDGYPWDDAEFSVGIYQFGDLGRGYAGLGALFNPLGVTVTSQAGYLPGLNVPVNATGALTYDVSTDQGATLSGPNSVIGRALVVHNATSDLTEPFTLFGLAAGAGVIGLVSPDEVAATFLAVNPGDTNVASAAPTATRGVCHMDTGRVTMAAYSLLDDAGDTVTESSLSVELTGYPAAEVERGTIIHEWGDVSDPTKLGEHYTTAASGSQHGLFPSVPRHAGDLVNMEVRSTVASADYTNDLVFVPDVIGRSFAAHQQADDGSPVNGGNVGDPDAGRYCVIGVARDEPLAAPRRTFRTPSSASALAPGSVMMTLACLLASAVAFLAA